MSGTMAASQSRKEIIKTLIRALHTGADPEQMTKRFQQVIHGVSSTELAKIEEELIEEGMPREEVRRLCDVHLSVFREALEQEEVIAPPGHPINIQMEEHKILLRYAQDLARSAQRVLDADSLDGELARIVEIEAALKDSESHYVREENVIFPYLEKHGVHQPPAIMWMEHDQIRAIKKSIYGVLAARQGMVVGEFAEQLSGAAVTLAEMLSSHFYKENKILFPTALRVFEESEWPEIRSEFDELGYCSFTPERPPLAGMLAEVVTAEAEVEGLVRFATGTLSLAAIEAIFSTLPVDITFVDKDDRVRFFNQAKDRIFPRAKAIIGRTVQRCHPQKSVGVVTRILDDFRHGRRDAAEFWLELSGRFVHIRYFAVRDRAGEYLGCLEVMQDVTGIRALKGQKRLLDE